MSIFFGIYVRSLTCPIILPGNYLTSMVRTELSDPNQRGPVCRRLGLRHQGHFRLGDYVGVDRLALDRSV